MTKSRIEINRDSDLKRGIVKKTYSLDKDTVDLIDSICEKDKISRKDFLKQAIDLYLQSRHQRK